MYILTNHLPIQSWYFPGPFYILKSDDAWIYNLVKHSDFSTFLLISSTCFFYTKHASQITTLLSRPRWPESELFLKRHFLSSSRIPSTWSCPKLISSLVIEVKVQSRMKYGIWDLQKKKQKIIPLRSKHNSVGVTWVLQVSCLQLFVVDPCNHQPSPTCTASHGAPSSWDPQQWRWMKFTQDANSQPPSRSCGIGQIDVGFFCTNFKQEAIKARGDMISLSHFIWKVAHCCVYAPFLCGLKLL